MGKAFKAAFLALFQGITVGFIAFGDIMQALANVAKAGNEMTADLPEEARDDRLLEQAIRRADHAKRVAALETTVVDEVK